MKRMKKLGALALAIVMTMSLTIFARAEDSALQAKLTKVSGDTMAVATATFAADDNTNDDLIKTLTITVTSSGNEESIDVAADEDFQGYVNYSNGVITIQNDEEENIATVTLTGTLDDSVASVQTITFVTGGAAGGEVTNLDEPAVGGGNGKGITEGGDPDKVISVILPTVSDGAYDMILDAHGLLKDTGFARLGTLTGDDADISIADAAQSKHLFFNAGESEGKTVYGQDSIELSIINKSQIDVDVTLNAEVAKNDAAVSFVDSAGLSDATGAAMYLAVVNTPVKGDKSTETAAAATTDALVDGDDGKATVEVKSQIKTVDVFKRDLSNGVYSYIVDTEKVSQGAPNTDYNSTKFKLTGDINTDAAWDNVESNKLELTLTWKVEKAAAAEPVADADPTATVTKQAASGAFAEITISLGTGAKAAESVKAFKFGTSTWVVGSSSNVTLDGTTLSVKLTNNLYTADAGTVVFSMGEGNEDFEVAVSGLKA